MQRLTGAIEAAVAHAFAAADSDPAVPRDPLARLGPESHLAPATVYRHALHPLSPAIRTLDQP